MTILVLAILLVLAFFAFCKPRFGGKNGWVHGGLVAGMNVVLSEDILTFDLFKIQYRISRHSVEHCTCSWCLPHGQYWKKLPHVGRFEIDVPPKFNEWKWTHFTLRIGQWQYYFLLPWQIFPSVKPFFKAERWTHLHDKASDSLKAEVILALEILSQESAFGHKPRLSDAVADIAEIPIEDLTVEQARRLIADAKKQHARMMKEEGEARLAGTWKG